MLNNIRKSEPPKLNEYRSVLPFALYLESNKVTSTTDCFGIGINGLLRVFYNDV